MNIKLTFISILLSVTLNAHASNPVDSTNSVTAIEVAQEKASLLNQLLNSSRLIFTRADSVVRTMFIDFTPNGKFLLEVVDVERQGNVSSMDEGRYTIQVKDNKPVLQLDYIHNNNREEFSIEMSKDKRVVFLNGVDFLMLFNQSKYYRDRPNLS